MGTLVDAIIGNLVGDYLLQNDWMALNKKNNILICAVHASIWTICVGLFAWGGIGWAGLAILFLVHLIQDHTFIITKYMDFVGQYKFRTGPCKPWAGIIVDNVFHILQIFIVVKLGL